MKKSGYSTANKIILSNFYRNTTPMQQRGKAELGTDLIGEYYETLQLNIFFEVEKQLNDAEHKALAFSTMVDIA